MAELPPKSAFCSHTKMEYESCEYCEKKKKKCRLECPDCGFYWLLEEDFQ
jgi:hypothetical protein